VTHVPTEPLFVKITIREKGCRKKSLFFKFRGDQNHHFLNFGEIKIIIFLNFGGIKIIIFWKIVKITFFRKCVCMSQNGHFFSKNVEKTSPQNHENYVLLRENAFFKVGQSGRINFIWGGFSAFKVYALSLMTTSRIRLCVFSGFPTKNTQPNT